MPPFVVGGHVVRPDVATGLIGLVVVVLVGVTHRAVGACVHPLARWILSGLAVLAVCLVVIRQAILGSIVSYVVLEHTGPSGCQVVVVQRSFLLLGSGDLGAVGPRGAIDVPSDYTSDDGGQPASTGSATVTWAADTATVELVGAEGQSVRPRRHELTC